jgi:AraC-like DNA-binding protein
MASVEQTVANNDAGSRVAGTGSPYGAPILRFRTRLRGIIRSSLSEGYPSVEQVAEQLKVPVRTLQRRLNEQGVTYSDVVETFRYREACRLLRRTVRPVAAIAAALGYQDPSHFSRAFLRWSGMRPTQYRTAQLSAPEAPSAS